MYWHTHHQGMPVQELSPLFGVLTDQSGSQQRELVVESAEEQELVDFVSVVLADTHQEPRRVLFRGAVNTRPAVWGGRP